MYHHINPHRGDTVTVSPETFATQMESLVREGIRTLTVRELLAFLDGEYLPPARSVLITFDDGWLDNYLYAFPVLKNLGMKAAFFLVSDRVHAASATPCPLPPTVPNHETSKVLLASGLAGEVALSWQLVDEMRFTGLAEFHPHSASHRPCDELSPQELERELHESRRVIQEHLGEISPCFCWPYGKWSASACDAAINMGYRGLFTIEPGLVYRSTCPFAIPRFEVREDTNLLQMWE
jgi:peptidoglycan/xylan/chitin deacetylase (PgdA/CDA1 family)